MASILVSEAGPDVRKLLVTSIEQLGHTAIVLGGTRRSRLAPTSRSAAPPSADGRRTKSDLHRPA